MGNSNLDELSNADAIRYGIDLDNLKTYECEIKYEYKAIGKRIRNNRIR